MYNVEGNAMSLTWKINNQLHQLTIDRKERVGAEKSQEKISSHAAPGFPLVKA